MRNAVWFFHLLRDRGCVSSDLNPLAEIKLLQPSKVKKAAPEERPNCRGALNVQTMLILVCGLVLCGAVSVFGSAYTVNQLKNMLVGESRAKARAAVLAACEEINLAMKEMNATNLADVMQHPDVRREMERMATENSIVLAALTDREGKLVDSLICDSMYQHGGGPMLAVSQPDQIRTWQDLKDRIPTTITPVDFPLIRNNETVGHLHVGFESDPIGAQIDTLSRQITSSLIGMVLTVFGILIVTIVLVYFAFQRQMDLVEQTAESQHLASLGTLASGLAHEIRNPLHAMNLHLEVVREDIESGHTDPATANTIGRVQTQITHLNSILSNFLTAATACRLELQEMHVDRLVREVVCFLKPEFQKHEVEVEIDLPAQMLIRGDEKALHQVLLNLLLNARQAVEKAPVRRIRITAERDRKAWRLYIDDSGPGLPPGEEETVFKTFVSKRDGGTGFGLSVARRILAAHDGSIGAGRGPLGGARFFVEFPVASATPAVA